MIIKTGIDIIEISRFEKLYNQESFIKKIMNEDEIKRIPSSQDKAISYCGKIFSAKESISKAFGFGIGSMISFHDITIQKDTIGKPFAQIDNDCLSRILNHFNASKISIDISISDSDFYIATSCVVLIIS